MSDEDEGRAGLLMQPPDLFLHRGPQVLVECGKRLVEQKHGRLEDQGAGQRHPLLLAAGQAGWPLLFMPAQADTINDPIDAALDVSVSASLHLQRKGNVLLDRHMRKQRIALEDHAEGALFGGDGGDIRAVLAKRPRCRRLEAGQDHQEGAFARAGGAEKCQELTGADGQRDIAQGMEIAIGLAYPVRCDFGRLVPALHRRSFSNPRNRMGV